MASTNSFGLLLVGRFILGFAVSLSAIAECIYISEISTPEKRGKLNVVDIELCDHWMVDSR
jgi:predicted MFS family arabinose efflux permease